MMKLSDRTVSVVLLGRLNPMIFTPGWLARNNIIGPQEAEAARENGIEVIAPNITSLALGSMKLIVEEERFHLTAADEPLIRCRDFASATFRLLSHTPVRALGININATLRGDSPEKWDALGDMLAPKEPWGDFVKTPEGKRNGGLRSIVMERSTSFTDRDGYTRFTLNVPENRFLEANLQVNNHFRLMASNEMADGGDAYRLIDSVWDEVERHSHEVMDRILYVANNS